MGRKLGHLLLFAGFIVVILLSLSIYIQLDFPSPTGPYPVGRITLHWIDSSRPEILTEAPDVHREVVAEFWYPAQAGTGTTAPYFPDLDRVASALSASGEVDSWQVLGLRYMRSKDLLDAQLNSQSASYPIVLLSPGNGTNVEFYAGIADELASHGYIVVGLNHPYDVAAVALDDGSIAQFAIGPNEMTARQAWVAERVATRTDDIHFVLNQLEALNVDGTSPFVGRLDLDRIGAMGHSLGGIAAAQACVADSRIDACLNLDGLQAGGPFSTDQNALIPQQPFMMITKEPTLAPAMIAEFESILSGSYRVVIKGATHNSFTDGPVLMPSLLPIPTEADHILALTRAYTLGFFEQTLKGQPSELLAASTQNEQVSVEVYPPF